MDELRVSGQRYLNLGKVDTGVFAYKYLHLVAFERLEGPYSGDTFNPMVIYDLFMMPYTSFENSNSTQLMDQWLNKAMNDQLEGEAF